MNNDNWRYNIMPYIDKFMLYNLLVVNQQIYENCTQGLVSILYDISKNYINNFKHINYCISRFNSLKECTNPDKVHKIIINSEYYCDYDILKFKNLKSLQIDKLSQITSQGINSCKYLEELIYNTYTIINKNEDKLQLKNFKILDIYSSKYLQL